MLAIAPSVLVGLVVAQVGSAHITAWHPSLYGFNYPDVGNATKQNYQTNAPVAPLRQMDNLTLTEWLGHGMRNLTPGPDEFLDLPAGSSVTMELACNRAFTTYGIPTDPTPKPRWACVNDTGPLHMAQPLDPRTTYETLNGSLFGGTALAIAYESDVWKVNETDFTIISVNSSSPYFRLTDYHIPAGLPPCPPGGCICSWNWIHLKTHREGYGNEIYNTFYRCKVSGQTGPANTTKLARGTPPVFCEDDLSKCISGPKQPMYIFQVDGNNMDVDPDTLKENPSYNLRYGFTDGAQQNVTILSIPEDSGSVSTANLATCLALVGSLFTIVSHIVNVVV